MNSTIRIVLAIATLAFATACVCSPGPKTHETCSGGKTYVPTGK